MLRWIGRKYMDMQEVREENRKNGEAGFTLIELLVVVIIIGILAAIAIPTFLAQRERAFDASAKSDLRNASAAAVSCQTANGGSYTTPDSCFTIANLEANGYNSSENVTLTPGTANANTWTATAKHAQSGTTWAFNSDTGRVVEQ